MRALLLALALLFGAGNAAAEPALWKVQGPNATIYLFGTVHVLKPAVVWRSAKIDAAIKAADTLWLEVPDADDDEANLELTRDANWHARSARSARRTHRARRAFRPRAP